MILPLTSPALVENTALAGTSAQGGVEPFFRNMDLRQASLLLQRRLKLVLGVTAAGALLAFLAALLLTSQYRAEAIVMQDARQTRVVDVGSVVSGLPSENTALRSEIDIIMSRSVIDRVVNKLDLTKDPEMNPRHWFSRLNVFRWFGGAASEKEKSRERSIVARNIGERLMVTNDGRSFSIHIMFDSRDPEKAALIANAIADEYLVDQLEAKYEVTARANKWLNDHLGVLKQQVEVAEKAVEDFRQKTKLIEIQGTTVSARQMEDINSQLVAARGQTSQAEARLRSIQNLLQSKDGVNSAADVLNSPLIQRLREQEAEVRRREAEMASRYGELHPKMIKSRAEYRDLQNKIAEEVHKVVQSLSNEVDIARAKEAQLEKELQNLEKRAGVEMKDSVTLRQLQREAEANRTLYENFLSRFKQTDAQQNLQLADSRIIARAEPPLEPAFPKKGLFVLIGALLGAVLGVLMAYLVEYFDRGFRNSLQVEEMTGIPVVGMVPSLSGISGQAAEDYVVERPMSAYSEALRTVRTAIHFSNVDNPPKTVMVTSATPGEGKTTFCLSLGRSLAKAGGKILLIDADLRRPRIADVTGLPGGSGGLAALLAGEKSFKEVVKRDPVVEGLDIIPATSKAPNAQDLLGSHQMHKVLQDAAKNYDLVIVDSPPILAVSDAAMAARSVDTTLFLIRWAETPRETVVHALKQLRNFGCKVAGVVMMQVDVAEQAKYGDGYYHKNYHEYYAN